MALPTHQVVRPCYQGSSPANLPDRTLAVVQYGLLVSKPALLVKDKVTSQPSTHKRPSSSF